MNQLRVDQHVVNEPSDFVESPGAMLSAARVRAGLSIAELADRSRVSISNLEALESDNWEALPAMAYARGFMRLYAREVGLDPEAVIARLDTSLDQHDDAEEVAHLEAEQTERRVWWEAMRTRTVYAAALGALIVVFIVAMFGIAPKTLEAAPADDGAVDPPASVELVEQD